MRHHKKQQSAILTYDASTELLIGRVGEHKFHDLAYSGGSRGHKARVAAPRVTRYLLANPLNDSLGRLATTREQYNKKKDTYTQRGGTLPPGHYHCVYVEDHPTFGECIRLDQMRDARFIYSPFARVPIAHGRGGFFIHGHGPKGSDGCIVFASDRRRGYLNHAIRDFAGRVELNVVHVSYQLPAELEPRAGQITV